MPTVQSDARFSADCEREDAYFSAFVADFLGKLEPHVTWRDLRADVRARREGYDFVLKGVTSSGPVVRVEYKGDHKQTPNIAFEAISQLPYGSRKLRQPGWGITSRAGWLVYDLIGSGYALIAPMPVLREYAFAQLGSAKATSCINHKEGQYFTYSLLLPIAEVLGQVEGARLVPRAGAVTSTTNLGQHKRYIASPKNTISSMLRWFGGFVPPAWNLDADCLDAAGLFISHGRAGVDSSYYGTATGQARLLALARQLYEQDISRNKNIAYLKTALEFSSQ